MKTFRIWLTVGVFCVALPPSAKPQDVEVPDLGDLSERLGELTLQLNSPEWQDQMKSFQDFKMNPPNISADMERLQNELSGLQGTLSESLANDLAGAAPQIAGLRLAELGTLTLGDGFLAQAVRPRSSVDDRDYDAGTRSLDQSRWEDAIRSFDSVIDRKSSHSDGALYWKAYAENRLGHRDAALATIAELHKQYPKSRWLEDSRALEVEVHQETGQPVSPDGESNEELKLVALNALMQSSPDRALPILDKLLHSNSSPRLKERALFVLTQNSSPKARETLLNIARGNSNPDLQMKAVRYVGMIGGKDGAQQLASLYSNTSDPNVKHAVIQAFQMNGSTDFLFNAAKSEQNPDLRRDAIKTLAIMGAKDQLWQLYSSENSVDNKASILQAMFLTGNSDKLFELARTEKDPKLRKAAIRSLGLMSEKTSNLPSLYAGEQDPEVRKEILNALFTSGNAKALVDIARKENDPRQKQEIVQRLSSMGSREATDYMLEILNK